MKRFDYHRPADLLEAVRLGRVLANARYVAGGTNLLDLMKLQIETPAHVIDLSRTGLDRIEHDGAGLRIGSMVRNADLAADMRVRRLYPVLARALLAGASGQIRNRATVGGNLLQRPRCPYFYNVVAPCNKRRAGSGCAAIDGYARGHAILGTSGLCIAVHPSDMAVALAALGASVVIRGGAGGERTISLEALYSSADPQRETTLLPGDLITHVLLPAPTEGPQRYRKVRDRASYAFAVVSVAQAGDAFAIGGVASHPWRASALESARSRGSSAEEAVAAEMGRARPRSDNAYKVSLVRDILLALVREAR